MQAVRNVVDVIFHIQTFYIEMTELLKITKN